MGRDGGATGAEEEDIGPGTSPGTTSSESVDVTTEATATAVADADDSASNVPGPGRADVAPDSKAIPDLWRLAGIAAVLVGGVALALLLAQARSRGGAHRKH